MSKARYQKAVELGKSTWNISKEFGIPQSTVRRRLKSYGLKTIFKANKRGCHKKHLCVVCGENNSKEFYGHRRSKCKKCHNKEGLEKGKEQRRELIRLLGGECLICGFRRYEAALSCHHLDPLTKDPMFKGHRRWSRERLLKEIETCILLCRNCHAAVHSGELKVSKSMIKKNKI